jgi:hypothetical protein
MKHIEARHIEAVDVTNCSDCPHSYWKGENGSPRDDYGAAVCNLLGRRISDTIVPYREIDPNCPLPDKATKVKKQVGRASLSKLFGR